MSLPDYSMRPLLEAGESFGQQNIRKSATAPTQPWATNGNVSTRKDGHTGVRQEKPKS